MFLDKLGSKFNLKIQIILQIERLQFPVFHTSIFNPFVILNPGRMFQKDHDLYNEACLHHLR